ncbi:type IV secretion system protein [Nonomuraea antimicrobica]
MQSAPQIQAGQPAPDVGARQTEYAALGDKLRNDPRYAAFSGRDWSNRLGVAIGALIAALVAGTLIFLVAVSLLVLKVGFLLLLILGPIFLLIGVHPGSGRIVAMRWVEMLIGTLLRQAVLTIVLSVLVYGYALIISTAMPWGMQVLFMALLTITVFFYRRPFQHLFASMSGHTVATRMLGEAASSSVLERSAGVLPPVASARIGRWGLRKAEPLIRAAGVANPAGAAATAATGQVRARGEEGEGAASGTRIPATAAPLDTEQQSGKAAGRATLEPRRGTAPPLNLGTPARTRGPAAGGPRTGGTAAASGSGSGAGAGSGSGSGAAGSAGVPVAAGPGAAARPTAPVAPAAPAVRGSAAPAGPAAGRASAAGHGRAAAVRAARAGCSVDRGVVPAVVPAVVPVAGPAAGPGQGRFAVGRRRRAVRRVLRLGRRPQVGRRHLVRPSDLRLRRAVLPLIRGAPLWLRSSGNGGGSGGDNPSVPFWLKPNNSDKD